MVVRVMHQLSLIYKCNLLRKTLITKSTTTIANFLLAVVAIAYTKIFHPCGKINTNKVIRMNVAAISFIINDSFFLIDTPRKAVGIKIIIPMKYLLVIIIIFSIIGISAFIFSSPFIYIEARLQLSLIINNKLIMLITIEKIPYLFFKTCFNLNVLDLVAITANG